MPSLCGFNTGQHVLLDLQTGDVAELSLYLDTSVTYSRAWTVRVSQLECDPNMAGCFQYWTGNSGVITSFNFFNPDSSRQVHLGRTDWCDGVRVSHCVSAGLDYTVCVRREVGHCCLKLSPTTSPDGWDLNGVGCSSDCNTANTCKTDGNDFLLIPDANMNGRNPDQSFTRWVRQSGVRLMRCECQVLREYPQHLQCGHWGALRRHLRRPLPPSLSFSNIGQCREQQGSQPRVDSASLPTFLMFPRINRYL